LAGDSPTWRDTAIWERIDELASSTDEDTTSNAAAVKAALEHASCLPAIEEILRSGPSQADFTLHDDRHSFRVAKRMVEIIPPDVFPSLNVYELALLLLSAYLHDIGMTPSLGRVHKYEHYLRTGASDGACDIEAMSAADTVDLQGWLDNWGEDVEIPMSADSGRGVSRILQY
jgi:hypothetical protein